MNKSVRRSALFVHSLSWLLGIVFLLAAFSKIGGLKSYWNTLQALAFLPHELRVVAFLLLPGLELVLGTMLLMGKSPRETAGVTLVLLTLFLGLSVALTLSGQRGGCGCFRLPSPKWLQWEGWVIVGRNSVLWLMGVVLVIGTCDQQNSNRGVNVRSDADRGRGA
jgi:uncharacterized membrane protein YphA (DoxX/SURF4 family)